MQMYYTRTIAHLCWIWLAAVPCSAVAQNLLVNGDFAIDLSGWQTPGTDLPAWSSMDVNGAVDSGSAYVINTNADPNVQEDVFSQCVPISQSGLYQLHVSTFVASAQPANGQLVVNGYARASANCTGGYWSASGDTITSIDQWHDYTIPIAVLVSPLPSTASMQVVFSVLKTDAGGSFGGYIDAVSLIYYETVFANGFE